MENSIQYALYWENIPYSALSCVVRVFVEETQSTSTREDRREVVITAVRALVRAPPYSWQPRTLLFTRQHLTVRAHRA